jgi:hypothetical protein
MRRVILLAAAAALALGCARAQLETGLTAEPRLEATIDGLGDALMRHGLTIDSLELHTDSLRVEVQRLETALRAREDTIRALRLELQRLKEIDLKPRSRRGTGVRGH